MIGLQVPSTSLDIARWFLVLTAAYTTFRLITCFCRKAPLSISSGFVSDALLFSGSILLLIGVWSPETMKALGDPTPYLVLAGFAGLGVSLGAAFREGSHPNVNEKDARKLNAVLTDSRVKALLKEIEKESSNKSQ